MSVLSVSYDLRKPDKDYATLIDALKKYTHYHHLKSHWYLDTSKKLEDVRDELLKLVDANDQLIVFRLRQHWGSTGSDGGTAWLKSDKRTWD